MTKVIEADRGFKVWWHLTRPHTLTASFVPVFLGTAIALAIENKQLILDYFCYAHCKYAYTSSNKYVQ